MISYIKKNWIKLAIWGVGCIAIYFVSSSQDYPDFIEEYNIVTMDTISCAAIILVCYSLTSTKPFWQDFTQNTEEEENRIEKIEKMICKMAICIENQHNTIEEMKSNFAIKVSSDLKKLRLKKK